MTSELEEKLMNHEPSEGIGVEKVEHPSPEELELIPHGYVHNLSLPRLKSMGWSEHPDYEHMAGEVPGYYVLVYRKDDE